VCGFAKLAILLAPSARSHLAGEAFVSSHAAICRQRLSRLIFMGACLPAKKAKAAIQVVGAPQFVLVRARRRLQLRKN
jgi:hypothetical protein